MKSYSMDLRERVLADGDAGLSTKEVAVKWQYRLREGIAGCLLLLGHARDLGASLSFGCGSAAIGSCESSSMSQLRHPSQLRRESNMIKPFPGDHVTFGPVKLIFNLSAFRARALPQWPCGHVAWFNTG
jgi:hypothetical protein